MSSLQLYTKGVHFEKIGFMRIFRGFKIPGESFDLIEKNCVWLPQRKLIATHS